MQDVAAEELTLAIRALTAAVGALETAVLILAGKAPPSSKRPRGGK